MSEEQEALYPITFSVVYHSPPLTADKVPEGHGACSALLIGTYMEQPDGSMSFNISGLNDKGEELKSLQLFHMWTTFAAFLAEDLPDGGAKELCESVRQVIRKTKDSVLKSKLERKKDAN